MDNLRGILAAGGISADSDETIAELDRGLRQARRLYDFRMKVKLDKRQSLALSELMATDPARTLDELLSDRDEWVSQFLYIVPLDININGRVDRPENALFAYLCDIYFRLKDTRELGCNGPHYRFTKACMELIGLSDIMLEPNNLRNLLKSTLKRRLNR